MSPLLTPHETGAVPEIAALFEHTHKGCARCRPDEREDLAPSPAKEAPHADLNFSANREGLSPLYRYGLAVATKAPPLKLEERFVSTPDGPRTVMVPAGIDPGFAYRPGETAQ